METAPPLFKKSPSPEITMEEAKNIPTTVTPENTAQLTTQLSDGVAYPHSAFAAAAALPPSGDDFSDGANGMGLMTVDSMGNPEAFDANRQHHLLRHSLPTEARGSEALVHFGVETVADAAKIIKKLSQRDLQAKFKAVYGARTFSNNNNWLRRKLFEAIGLDPSKGAVKKPGAGGTQRRRRPAKAASTKSSIPRAPRRSRAELEADQEQVAEALLALGDAAWMVSQEEESEGCVPSASAEEVDGMRVGGGNGGAMSHDNSWSDRERSSEGRDVPSMEVEDPQQSVKTVDEEDEEVAPIPAAGRVVPRPINEGAADFAQVFSQGLGDIYAAMATEIQRAGLPTTAALPFPAPHPPLMMAAHPQLAMMHAMIASGAIHPAALQAAAAPAGLGGGLNPELFQRLLNEHPMAVMHKLMHGGMVPPVPFGQQ